MRPLWQSILFLGPSFVDVVLGFADQASFKSTAPVGENIVNNTNQWDLTSGPPINSASNFIFSSVSSFLQHWPNTRYRNGHSVVPGIIPVGTLLYHGADRNMIPDSPEWTATDPEHSYVFCRALQADSGCWHLTMVATRPLKVLYFDGSSAAKMDDGPMDSQDLVAWGEVKADWAYREGERINDLCEWGKKYEIDAFLRMEMDFEIMLCDFYNGVQPVSFLNLVPADQVKRRPVSRNPPANSSREFNVNNAAPSIGTIPKYEEQSKDFPLRIPPLFRVLEAGSWHNHFPGDPRIQLDYSRIISFYDPVSFPSLHAARLGQGRIEHRLNRISSEDVQAFFSLLDNVLRDWHSAPSGSGVDWKGLIRVITDRYAERLELLHYILNSTSVESEKDANATLKQAYRHMTGMIAPYILHSATPPPDDGGENPMENHLWASPIYQQCATTHTDYIENSPLASKLTHSEHVLLGAVKGVAKEICRVIVGLWAEGTEADLAEPDLTMFDRITESRLPGDLVELQGIVKDWRIHVENLMTWLDWSSLWLRCRPACTYEEMCYLPTWPWFSKPKPRSIFLRNWLSRFRDYDKQDETYKKAELENGEWVDPQPRCIRRLEPLEFKDE